MTERGPSSVVEQARGTSVNPASRAICGSWETMITVVPCCRARSAKMPRTLRDWSGSSAAVGSSASTMAGPWARARAMATRWRSPTERLAGICSSRRSMPRAVAMFQTASRRRPMLPRQRINLPHVQYQTSHSVHVLTDALQSLSQLQVL